MRIVVRRVLAELFGEAQDAERGHHHFVAAGHALEQLGDLVAMDLGDRLEVGQVRDRARVLDQREALAVERAAEPARVGDRRLRPGPERDEVLLVRVGVEIGPLLGALGIADLGAHVAHAGSNSSVSIVGRIAS